MRESSFDVRWMLMVRINFVKNVLSCDVQVISSIFMSYLELRLLALKFLKDTFLKVFYIYTKSILLQFDILNFFCTVTFFTNYFYLSLILLYGINILLNNFYKIHTNATISRNRKLFLIYFCKQTVRIRYE